MKRQQVQVIDQYFDSIHSPVHSSDRAEQKQYNCK